MLDITPPQPLLSLDPDLGQLLASERLTAAMRELRARVVTLHLGPWDPAELCHGRDVNLLIVRGVVAREVCVHDSPSAELFGPGDVIRAGRIEARQQILPTAIRWSALGDAAVAAPDRHTARALRSYPEVTTIVVDRLNARAERLAVSQAISQITGVEMRIEALLWHLAERWGRVGTAGLIIPVPLSHRMIGSLIGARRPTVSSAITRLADDHRVLRRPDGSWLLTQPEPPCVISAFVTHQHPAVRTIERPIPSMAVV